MQQIHKCESKKNQISGDMETGSNHRDTKNEQEAKP